MCSSPNGLKMLSTRYASKDFPLGQQLQIRRDAFRHSCPMVQQLADSDIGLIGGKIFEELLHSVIERECSCLNELVNSDLCEIFDGGTNVKDCVLCNRDSPGSVEVTKALLV